MNDNNYCVILAGGVGLKLWPASTHHKPKQFIDFLGNGQTLLQATYNRIARFVDTDNIIVSTNEEYKDLALQQLPHIKQENLLLEPMRRNTLPSATWATLTIAHRNPEARVLVVPSDQLILDEDKFEKEVMKAFDYVSETGRILSLGVMPTRAETNFGYVQMGERMGHDIYQVKSFTEKPEMEFAKIFMEDGEFLWNTGLFVWKADDFLRLAHEHGEAQFPNFKKTASMIENGLKMVEIVRNTFSMCPNITIERVCLEKMEHTDVMLCHFGWTDLGTWHSLYNVMPKQNENVVMKGMGMLYDCKGCIVRTPQDKIVILQGLEDYVVVEENNILVVCKKEDQNAIRKFVNDVNISLGDEFI